MESLSIIGAGISGLSLAQSLKSSLQIELFEKAEKPGGLIKCDVQKGNLFHRVGGHVFNAKNKEVYDWFWSFFDQKDEFIQAKRNAKIFIQNRLIGYPIENYLFELDKEIVAKILGELLHIEKSSFMPSLHFEEFLENKFGHTLYELYFKPYNSKLWNTDLSKVPLEWLEGKLPMPNIKDILLQNILKEGESQMVHSTFYYPKEGGSQFIANRFSKDLSITYQTPITSIQKREGIFYINERFTSEKVVYTGDIRKLSKVLQTTSPELRLAMKEVENLRSNGTSNLFCECDINDVSWLYIPEPFTKAHRIIYTGNFSENNNKGTTRRTCVVEFSGKVDLETMKEEIKKLPGNLVPLDFNYEPNSYVIQNHETREKISALKKLLEAEGFYLLGRFAEWEYYNMDKAIEAALSLGTKFKS